MVGCDVWSTLRLRISQSLCSKTFWRNEALSIGQLWRTSSFATFQSLCAWMLGANPIKNSIIDFGAERNSGKSPMSIVFESYNSIIFKSSSLTILSYNKPSLEEDWSPARSESKASPKWVKFGQILGPDPLPFNKPLRSLRLLGNVYVKRVQGCSLSLLRYFLESGRQCDDIFNS